LAYGAPIWTVDPAASYDRPVGHKGRGVAGPVGAIIACRRDEARLAAEPVGIRNRGKGGFEW